MSDRIVVKHGDSREVLKQYPDNHFDSVVTDPPYALTSIVKRFGKAGAAPAKGNAAYMRASAGFMGQAWDNGETAFDPAFWAEVMRVLKPGGHVAAFSGTRTYHRMAVAIEDAGFEIRDQIGWVYGSGFPKSHDVSKGIDRAAGAKREVVGTVRAGIARAARKGGEIVGAAAFEELKQSPITVPATDEAHQWQGWGTALKPAWEPICLARKPLIGTVAENVLEHGTGAINVDGCRVLGDMGPDRADGKPRRTDNTKFGKANETINPQSPLGRFPANIIHDGSAEVVALFPDSDSGSGSGGIWTPSTGKPAGPTYGDGAGSSARFFYTAKADAGDRIGSKHPTVKPVDLMQWLVRLITPPGGMVLEPFAGSGTTGEAAFREGMRCVMIEREAGFVADIERRIGLLMAGPEERKVSALKTKIADGRLKDDAGPLFGGQAETVKGGGEQSTATSQIRTDDWPNGTQVVNSK